MRLHLQLAKNTTEKIMQPNGKVLQIVCRDRYDTKKDSTDFLTDMKSKTPPRNLPFNDKPVDVQNHKGENLENYVRPTFGNLDKVTLSDY